MRDAKTTENTCFLSTKYNINEHMESTNAFWYINEGLEANDMDNWKFEIDEYY